MAVTELAAFRAAASHVTVAAHIIALVTTILLLVWSIHFKGGLSLKSDTPDLIINSHSVIMFMGFIFVFGEAIMAYTTIPGTKKVRKMVHSLFQLIALSMAIFGVHTAFKFHDESLISDMYTLHSWFGMITVCLFGSQWLFGLFYFGYPGAPLPARTMALPWHVFAGLTIFLLAICTAETGLVQNQVDPGAEAKMINFIALGIFLFGFTVVLSAILPRLAAQSLPR